MLSHEIGYVLLELHLNFQPMKNWHFSANKKIPFYKIVLLIEVRCFLRLLDGQKRYSYHWNQVLFASYGGEDTYFRNPEKNGKKRPISRSSCMK